MSQTIVSSLTPLFARWWSVIGAIAAGVAFVAYMADRDARTCILLQAFPGFAMQVFMTLLPIFAINDPGNIRPTTFIVSFLIGIFCGVNFLNFVVFIIYILAFTSKKKIIWQFDGI